MVTTKTHAQAPERSLDQRMEALQRANDVRVRRAQLKRDLKAGRESIETILLAPPEWVETAKVFDMLMAVPKFGRVKAARLLNQCRISQSKTVGGLSERQRTELVELFNHRGLDDPLPSVAAASSSSTRAVRRRAKGTLIKGLLERVSGARDRRLGDDAPAATG